MFSVCLFIHLFVCLLVLNSIASAAFKGKQRNDPSEAERLANAFVGRKVVWNLLCCEFCFFRNSIHIAFKVLYFSPRN